MRDIGINKESQWVLTFLLPGVKRPKISILADGTYSILAFREVP